ncbi:prepilin peptidase [Thermoanaerobacterium butyriciformans]|uniref:Flp pilus assembly protein protease CpaA n=1 Tax=Thermoanaerobacterium butyriciformans TaxID=1702242 RepID=A0ABS4NAY7_9THEO|nr:Flp pilus assembly protein protease CpaA [Thermoanaerobacterium butyriciformans]
MSVFLSMPVVLLTAYAAYTDIKRKQIDDWVSIVIVVYGFTINSILDRPKLIESLFYAFAIFISLYLIYLITNGSIGGGDVKLLTALTFYFADKIIILLFLASVIGLVYGLIKGIKEKTYLKTETIFAPSIFAATVLTIPLMKVIM